MEDLAPIEWTETDSDRLERDCREVEAFAPDLQFQPPTPGSNLFQHGGWLGRLPVWPFDRPEPQGVRELVGEAGISVAVVCSSAHPMVAPSVIPLDPEPTIHERTQHAWHVAPDGSLCLLQSDGSWDPEASVIELLAKAVGWRIEYGLMQAGVIERMSNSGIVSDGSLDHLVARAASVRPAATINDGSDDW